MWLHSLLVRSSRTQAGKTRPAPSLRQHSRCFRPRLEILEDRTLLSTYTVNNLGDTGAGSGLTGDLRYCLTNATSGSDTITFAQGLTGSITLQSALPTLNASVAIQGPGANQYIVVDGATYSGYGYFSSPLFSVGMGAYVQISGLTIGSVSYSEAIDNSGKLLVNDCTLVGGYDSINNKGSATVSNSTFSQAGTLLNSGTLSVADSTFHSCGGIENNGGSATVADSNFNYCGSIKNNGGSATISSSTLSDGYQAIYNAGTMTLNNSTLSGNRAYGQNADLQVNGTWPTGGTTKFFPATNGMGGGIYMASGTLTISSSTIANNEAIGGSTDSFGGTAGNGLGGGLYIAGGTVTINNSTFAGNQALSGKTDSFYGGSPGVGYGGGIDNAAGALQMYDTIVADNTGSAAPDLNGSVTSQGHNLIGNTTGGSGFASSDLVNVDPRLGPLQNNGGPTQTMALLVESPALNAGDNTNAPAYDQRGPGYARIVGSGIDIGAFEDQNTAFLQVSGFPSSATAGTANTFTVTAVYANGTVDPNYTGTVHFTSSDPKAVLPADYTFTAADQGVHTFTATLKTATLDPPGSQSLMATDTANGILVGSETSITVNPAAVASLAFYYPPSSTTAGSAFTVLVITKDAYGNYTTDYHGTVHFTSSDPKAVLPADYTFTSSDRGQHFFSITLKTAGSQSLTVTDTVTSSITGAETGITVNPVAASTLIVSGFPATITAGNAGTFTVTALNADGSTDSNYTGTVHFTSSDPLAVLPANYTFTAADAGVHTFSATLKTAGMQSITATDTTSGSITGSDTSITVLPAAASQLAFGQQPSLTTAGQTISPAVTVDVEDPYGNRVSSDSSTVTLTLGSGTFAGGSSTVSVTASSGVATFSALAIDRAGIYTLQATDGSLTSASSGSFTVQPAAASTLSLTGFLSPTTAGVAHNVTVTLRDPYGNIASGYTGTVHFSSSDPQAVLPANYSFTAADAGTHTFSVTLKTAGTQSITATDTTTASLTGTQGGITVNAAAARKFVLTAPASVTAGVPFSLTVTVEDAYGNVVTGYTGTIHFSSSDTWAKLPANYTFTAADKGVHTFAGLVLRKKGNQKITVSDTHNSALTSSAIVDVL